MFRSSLLSKFFRSEPRSSAARVRRAYQPSLEHLEDRWVPAGFSSYSTLHVGKGPGEFSTIQAAVNAAHNGDRVLVDPGIYQEQVTINKSIELDGAFSWGGAQAIILAPTSLGAASAANPDAIVRVTGNCTNAEIGNLTIEGAAGGTANLLYGIRVDTSAFAEIDNNTITNIIDSSDGQAGVAVDLGNTPAAGKEDQTNTAGSAAIDGNTITNYQRAGIVINHAGSWAEVGGNVIAASSAFQSDSQTGVEVSFGASAQISRNCISGNSNGSDGVGVFLFKPGAVQVQVNWITNNDYGVFGSDVVSAGGWCNNTQVSISCNAINGNTYVGIEFDNSSGVSIDANCISGNGSDNTADGGIYLFQSTNNSITNNLSTNNDGSGIYVDAGSTGNTIRNNVFYGNDNDPIAGNADAVDLSSGGGTAGTANAWCGNQGDSFITNSGQTLFQHNSGGKGGSNHGHAPHGHGNHYCFDLY